MFDEPWTHDSATSILSIFQPKFYFTPLLAHLWWSDSTVPRNAQDFSLSACGTPPQTPMPSCWSLICAPVGCLDGNLPLVWTCANLCKPWAMESRSAPLTSYHAKPSNHMEIVEPPLVCSLPCGTGDLSGIHSCSSEAHDVLGAVIEMPHLRGRDVDILLGQPWTHETEPTSGSWSSKP